MPYELRLAPDTVRTFETQEEALDCARRLLRTKPDSDPEIRDTSTGQPVAPGATRGWRDELSRKVGF